MSCGPNEKDYQPFPRKGRLRDNSNLSLSALHGIVGSEGTVAYCYVVDSVRSEGGRLVHRGSGPNFRGGMVTLCTCKHLMRTFLSPDDWKGTWIAGFTGVGVGRGKNALVYLTKVAHAFESHYDLWYSTEIPAEAKRAKSARSRRYGDLFQPINESVDPYDPRSYYPPHETHPHARNAAWHRDVRYTGCSNREAALLAGDPAHSFLWDRPTMFFPTQIGRGQPKMALSDLVSRLRTD